MTPKADFIEARRREAWAFGRELRDSLLEEYKTEYGLTDAPPPAKIADELIRDFLHFQLHYDPLAPNVFAKASMLDDRVVITINSMTGAIKGVKDEGGVQAVGKFHETIHGVRDLIAAPAEQGVLVGFDLPPVLVCYRGGPEDTSASIREREFWAEEAGRAAAVSYGHLNRSEAFIDLMHRHDRLTNGQAWHRLYQAAEDIGVNITALVTQLRLEGWIAVERGSSGKILKVQPSLGVAS
jgi:hypothetical protein